MAVRGFQEFRERFREHRDNFLLIGGAACELWFNQQGLRFRATQDIDMVLLLEALHPDFMTDLWSYLQEAGYRSMERSGETSPRLYRFEKTDRTDVPKMIELLSRSPEAIFPEEDQRIVPIRMEDAPSLSAILLNQNYYEFLLAHRIELEGCPCADVHALILFKARAWLDLKKRKAKGEFVRSTDIDKHRTDVFRLAATLTADDSVTLPEELVLDLHRFLDAFPPDSGEWRAILSGLQSSGIRGLPPDTLLETLKAVYLEESDV